MRPCHYFCGKIRKYTREKTVLKAKDLVLKNVYSKSISTERWGTDALYIEMKNKDGLVEIYGQLVDLVGIENTEKIYYTLRGQQIVFPMRLYKTEFISKEVRRRYNGKNVKELANEYGYTERYLRSFIKNDGRKQ